MKKTVAFFLCIVLCVSFLPSPALAAGTARDTSLEETLASGLKSLGLFKGVSDTDFDLGREPSRAEALVMLIRVLGKESDALGGTWTHPFTDVASWADKYVGYAYQNGLTNGVSATLFGAGSASASMYLTFVLRALGYSDTNGADFTWDDPYTLAENVGILPGSVNLTAFWRADVVLISYAALPVTLKGSDQSLASKLIAAGVFTQQQYNACYDKSALNGQELNAKQIFTACSPAVFSLETYTSNGDSYGLASGFFIDESGIAVTNFHVLENAQSANAVLSDGTICTVEGVLLYDSDLDYAIIKVAGTGFSTIGIGDSGALESGETIYAIGNPEGLTNSISDGIVSNPSRQDLNGMIQITAPISSGSSGGALINVYGKAVGITAASYVDGQNLNFAVPINSVIPDEDLAAYEEKNGLTTLAACAAYIETQEYQSAPSLGELYMYEEEPNDTEKDAGYLFNGLTVVGYIDDEYDDVYLVQCNAKGTIGIVLISPAENKYVKDLKLTVSAYGQSTAAASSVYYESDDGTAARYLTYNVPKAGVYTIRVRSSALYKTANLDTDYAIYYLFKPEGAQTSDVSD